MWMYMMALQNSDCTKWEVDKWGCVWGKKNGGGRAKSLSNMYLSSRGPRRYRHETSAVNSKALMDGISRVSKIS